MLHKVAPHTGAWIEIVKFLDPMTASYKSLPTREQQKGPPSFMLGGPLLLMQYKNYPAKLRLIWRDTKTVS